MKLEYATQYAGKKYTMRAHRAPGRDTPVWTVRRGRRLITQYRWDFMDVYKWSGDDDADEHASRRLRETAKIDKDAAMLAAVRDPKNTDYMRLTEQAMGRHS